MGKRGRQRKRLIQQKIKVEKKLERLEPLSRIGIRLGISSRGVGACEPIKTYKPMKYRVWVDILEEEL